MLGENAQSVTVDENEIANEDDDYMSDTFVACTSDIRPGITLSYAQRRIMKIEAEKHENEERLRHMPKRAELERELRESALSTPICEDSKGFALLTKMGYKPGMSLGRKKEGIEEGMKEPIVIDIKTCRTGLGHKAEEEEKKKQRSVLLKKHMAARAKTQQFLLGDFRKRQRTASILKQLIGDIMKSRKACEELDSRNGFELPVDPHFWPIYKEGIEEEQNPSKKTRLVDEEHDNFIFKYPNGKFAPAEIQLNELHENDLIDRLDNITAYLRDKHFYCVWCGCKYESIGELSQQCPGSTRARHEGIDDE
uniref:G patch domain-containing protein 11 n=2 Tax=Parascaris univalens TaxID=6257 RepID=A0A915C6N7_PARUN